MTRSILKIAYLALVVGLSLPLAASAEKPEDKAGGKALEKRGQEAAEHANSQWQEDATRGQARADQARKNAEEVAEGVTGASQEDGEDVTGASEKADKQTKDAEKRARKEARGLADDDEGDNDHRKALSRQEGVEAEAAQGQIDKSAKQPRGKARGFWQRWFGGDEPTEE